MAPISSIALGNGSLLLRGEPGAAPASPPYRIVDAARPALSATDLGFTRGYGAFEAAQIIDGRAVALAYHLRRLDHSLALLGLPGLTSIPLWRETVEAFLEETRPGSSERSLFRVFISAGDQPLPFEPPERPTIVLARSPLPEDGPGESVTAALLSREVSSSAAASAPWLLLGAKTLSYATHLSANRYASERGADIPILHTTDGYVLEGSQSSIVARFGDLLRSPHPSIGILHGTTQASLFRYAESLGLRTSLDRLALSDLSAADSVYTLGGGSIRPIVRIDEQAFAADWELVRGFRDHAAKRETYLSDWDASSQGFPLGPRPAASTSRSDG